MGVGVVVVVMMSDDDGDGDMMSELGVNLCCIGWMDVSMRKQR